MRRYDAAFYYAVIDRDLTFCPWRPVRRLVDPQRLDVPLDHGDGFGAGLMSSLYVQDRTVVLAGVSAVAGIAAELVVYEGYAPGANLHLLPQLF
jgi:hypothetical protein